MSERRQVCLDVARPRGRLTSVVGAVFDRYGVVWAGASGDLPRRARAVPHRLDHQDAHRGAGHAGARRRAAARSTTRSASTSARSGTPRRRCASCSATPPGCRASRSGRGGSARRGGDFAALAAANDGSGRVAGRGEYYHYSNLGYGLLGEVLARVDRPAVAHPGPRRPARAARHDPDVVPAATARAARLERRPLHRHPHPRAADQHRRHGAGRPAVVDRGRPGAVGPVPRRGDGPTCSTRRRCTR